MTTTKQVKELVRPLLERHRDLVLFRRYLWIVPFDHFARRILIDRCSHPDLFVPSWSLTEMFTPSGDILSNGWCHEDIYTPRRGGGSWCASDPTTGRDFVEVVESKVLPLLRSLDNFETCVNFAFGHPAMARWIGREWSVMMHIAQGDLETARREWQSVGRKYVTGGKDWHPACQEAYDLYCEIGDLLLADDRVGLAAMLHRLESAAIIGTKIEPHWRRMPFPLETESAQARYRGHFSHIIRKHSESISAAVPLTGLPVFVRFEPSPSRAPLPAAASARDRVSRRRRGLGAGGGAHRSRDAADAACCALRGGGRLTLTPRPPGRRRLRC